MKDIRGLFRFGVLLPIVLGLSDGILTALTLASGHLVSNEKMTISLSVRIAVGALVAGAFVFYVSSYARLRGELIHAERELNLTAHGQLASSRLGRAVVIEAFFTTILSSAADFFGALIPLLTGVLLPQSGWGAVVASLILLGILGLVLARSVHGSCWLWCIALVAGGIVLSMIGVKLRIV